MESSEGYTGEGRTELDGIVFTATNGGDVVLKITDKGMFYKGKFVEDAGEAHRRFLDWLDQTEGGEEKE